MLTGKYFENGGFTLKTHQMFPVHTTREEFKNATITSHFGFVFEENSGRKEKHIIFAMSSFWKSSVFDIFPYTINAKSEFSNSSGLKSVFEKPRFRGGLAWTIALTNRDKAAFSNFSGVA